MKWTAIHQWYKILGGNFKNDLMMKKYNILSAIILIFSLSLASCENDGKEANLSPSMVYIINDGVQNISLYEMEDAYTYNLGIYKSGALKSDATVKIAVFTEAELNEYNTENGTNYSLIPATCYTISTSEVSFGSEVKDVNRVIDINFDVTQLKELPQIEGTYTLPIKIATSSITINKNKAISIITLDSSIPLISRSNWAIAGFSTEEATGEDNGKNGKAIHMIDNDINTFWHSKWDGGTDEMPHHVTIDMQQSYTIAQVNLIRRQGNNSLRAGEFWLSENNTDFVKAGDFQLEERDNEQNFPVNHTRGRYLKVIFAESNNPPHTSLAEVMVRGY
ncbi:BT_3987 domain-containing protein [Bacteroides sp. 519]|uniref:BT_3987 domain-containing protein n=1 Tax=Bacteroides sp. 519 TaxID=2302937 RepID=UPI0013D1D51F|nr:DUF1735 domain-containing protein [Bacteroides sp. 519]